MLKLFGGSQKLSNMLLHQKGPLCSLGLGGEHHRGEFNKTLTFVKASTSRHKGSYTQEGAFEIEERLTRKKPQQAKSYPRMHQLFTIVEDMGTTRQDYIKGIKLNLV